MRCSLKKLKPAEKKNDSKKTVVKLIDRTWTLDLLDTKDYGTENRRGYRYFLVMIDNLSEYGFGVPSAKKASLTIKN